MCRTELQLAVCRCQLHMQRRLQAATASSTATHTGGMLPFLPHVCCACVTADQELVCSAIFDLESWLWLDNLYGIENGCSGLWQYASHSPCLHTMAKHTCPPFALPQPCWLNCSITCS